MTQEDIIRMAREVYGETDFHESALFHLTQFAALVAAAGREASAKQLDALGCDHCAAALRARE